MQRVLKWGQANEGVGGVAKTLGIARRSRRNKTGDGQNLILPASMAHLSYPLHGQPAHAAAVRYNPTDITRDSWECGAAYRMPAPRADCTHAACALGGPRSPGVLARGPRRKPVRQTQGVSHADRVCEQSPIPRPRSRLEPGRAQNILFPN